MVTIITDLHSEPVRGQPKPQRTEKVRQRGQESSQRRPPTQRKGPKPKRKKSALAPMKKVHHQRSGPTMSELGKVTEEVYQVISERAGDRCEICGERPDFGNIAARKNCLQAAHLVRRTQGGRGDQPWTVAKLCGPSVNTGTCHNLVDFTAVGRRRALDLIEKLKPLYDPAEWPE